MFNPFDLFAIEKSFSLNQKQITEIYIQLQKQYHPDNFANEDAATKLAMLQKSTDINQAYEILKDDIKRAQSLLDLAKEEEAFTETVVNDKEFIMEQFQLRAQVDSLKGNFDFDKFLQLSEKREKLYAQEIAKLEAAFESKDYNSVQVEVHRLQFLRKLENELAALSS